MYDHPMNERQIRDRVSALRREARQAIEAKLDAKAAEIAKTTKAQRHIIRAMAQRALGGERLFLDLDEDLLRTRAVRELRQIEALDVIAAAILAPVPLALEVGTFRGRAAAEQAARIDIEIAKVWHARGLASPPSIGVALLRDVDTPAARRAVVRGHIAAAKPAPKPAKATSKAKPRAQRTATRDGATARGGERLGRPVSSIGHGANKVYPHLLRKNGDPE